jgi:hypothetical protein
VPSLYRANTLSRQQMSLRRSSVSCLYSLAHWRCLREFYFATLKLGITKPESTVKLSR